MVSKCLVAVMFGLVAGAFGWFISGIVMSPVAALFHLVVGEKVSAIEAWYDGWLPPVCAVLGLLLAVPVFSSRWWLRGILVGLLPSIIPLWLIVPYVIAGETSRTLGIRLCALWISKLLVWGLVAAWSYMKLVRVFAPLPRGAA